MQRLLKKTKTDLIETASKLTRAEASIQCDKVEIMALKKKIEDLTSEHVVIWMHNY